MRRFCNLAILCVISATTLFGQDAAKKEKISALLERSPSPANAVGYINIPALNGLMKNAGFTTKAATELEQVWFISDLNLGTMRPNWEAGYTELKNPLETEQLAKLVGGYVDKIGNQEVVHSPNQTYFVPLRDQPGRLGILRPTDRRLLASWQSPNINIQYSPFLNTQASQPEQFLSFMMAIELKDVLSPVTLEARLASLESLKKRTPRSAASIIASIQGMSVIVGRESLDQCIVKFEFTKPPASLQGIAPEMIAEILEKNGMAAPEIKTWKASVQGNTLSLTGPITQSSLSGLMSIFSLKSQAERAADRPSYADDQDRVAYETKHYFDEVNQIIERTRDHKSKTTGAMASWNDKRARQIDELGTLSVDPEMVQYGTNVAELLRGNALSVRNTNIQAGKVKANQSLDNGYYNDGYGYYNYNTTSDYQRVTNAMARGTAYGDYKSTLNQIDKLTAETRRAMTAKYQVQF